MARPRTSGLNRKLSVLYLLKAKNESFFTQTYVLGSTEFKNECFFSQKWVFDVFIIFLVTNKDVFKIADEISISLLKGFPKIELLIYADNFAFIKLKKKISFEETS